MARHFLDLPDARVLPTTGLQLVDQAVGHVVDVGAMGVVHGPAGTSEVLQLILRFHLIYDGVDPDLLLQVDDHLAHGNLRDWASFTQSAARLCAEHRIPVLDPRIVANAFALHGAATTA